MQEVMSLIESRINKTMAELDKVGAKKASKDVYERNLKELETELDSYFATEADNMKNRMVVNRLQALVNEFSQMANVEENAHGI